MPRRAPFLRSNRSRDHRVTRAMCLVDRMMSHPSNFSSASTAFPVLGSSDVHVWFCDLLHYAADQKVLAALLSGDERNARGSVRVRSGPAAIHPLACVAAPAAIPLHPHACKADPLHPPARMGSRRSVVPARRLSRSNSVCPIPGPLRWWRWHAVTVGVTWRCGRPMSTHSKLAQRFLLHANHS